jgi:hypothetical protein
LRRSASGTFVSVVVQIPPFDDQAVFVNLQHERPTQINVLNERTQRRKITRPNIVQGLTWLIFF